MAQNLALGARDQYVSEVKGMMHKLPEDRSEAILPEGASWLSFRNMFWMRVVRRKTVFTRHWPDRSFTAGLNLARQFLVGGRLFPDATFGTLHICSRNTHSATYSMIGCRCIMSMTSLRVRSQGHGCGIRIGAHTCVYVVSV